jgi:spore germination protein GerM
LATGDAVTCVAPDVVPGQLAVYFHCDQFGGEPSRTTLAVPREGASARPLTESLAALVSGPTLEEQEVGFYSPFSSLTADLIRSVRIEGSIAFVDFTSVLFQLSGVGTTNGSAMFLDEILATIFHFQDIESVSFAVNGSDAEWCEFVVADANCDPFVR